jgi:type I restriction enzyme S subunit
MMPVNGWNTRPLSALADYINGYAFKPEDWSKEGLPIIRIEQLRNPDGPSDYYAGKLPAAVVIDNGDLVFSWSASLFLRIWTNGRAALNQHLFKVVEKSGVDRLFLKAFIEFYLPDLTKASHGSTMQHITRKELNRFTAPLPICECEQSKIAEVLSTVDRAIAQTEALIAKQQRIKTGLMQDLLTRGIDEHGNLRNETTHTFKDSPLGRIPAEWVCESLNAFVPSAEYGISTSLGTIGLPVLRMNNLLDGEAELSDLKYADVSIPEHLWLQNGDVLFNRTNSWEHVGRTGIWRDQIEKATFASYLVRLNPHPKKLLPDMLNIWLNWEETQISMRRQATPAVQQVNINPTNLRSILAAFPADLSEQKMIVGRVTEVRKVLDRYKVRL